jgi:hypothetical protein
MSGFTVLFVWMGILWSAVLGGILVKGGGSVDTPSATTLSALDVTVAVCEFLVAISLLLMFVGLIEGAMGAMAFGLAAVIGLAVGRASDSPAIAALDASDTAGVAIGAAAFIVLMAGYVLLMGNENMTALTSMRRGLVVFGGLVVLMAALMVLLSLMG